MNFKLIENDAAWEQLLKEVLSHCDSEEMKTDIYEMLSGYLNDGVDFAVSVEAECLVIRIYDDEYLFLSPIALNSSASITDAADEVRKYAIREEIPITFIDVAADELPDVTEPFRFCESFPMDDEGETFMVRPLTEAAKIEELPTLVGTKITLTPIFEEDISDFARLSKDENTNRLFGYNYKEDYADAEDEHFYDVMKFEEEAGLSLSFAIRCDGEFAGEASLFGFDYLGSARVAVRLLPEYFGRGLGSEALYMIIGFAKDIDIRYLETAVKKENLPSINMTKKYMDHKCDEGDTLIFGLDF